MDSLKKHKEPEVKETPQPDYVYTGENNYEAPKPDPWTEENK